MICSTQPTHPPNPTHKHQTDTMSSLSSRPSSATTTTMDEGKLTQAVARFFALLEESLLASSSPPIDLVPVLFEMKDAASYLITKEGKVVVRHQQKQEGEEEEKKEEEAEQEEEIGCRYVCLSHPSTPPPHPPTSPPSTTYRITCSLPTLLGLASSRLSPSKAFLTGAVKVTGDSRKAFMSLGG